MRLIVITSKVSQLSGAPRRIRELIEGINQKKWNVFELNRNEASLLHIAPRFFTIPLRILFLFLRLMMAHKKFCPHGIVFFLPLDGFVTLLYRVFYKNTKIIYCDRADPLKGLQLPPTRGGVYFILRSVELSLTNFIEKTICLRSDKVIFNSKARYRQVQKRIGKQLSNAIVIHNNANPSWIYIWLSEVSEKKAELSEIASSFEGRKVIGFVGNLYEIGNGLDILLSAFKLVSERVPEALLVIVGDGPDKKKLRRRVSDLNLDDRVFFGGWAQNPLFYVMNFDVFVQPSRHHSCPNAILESLVCGIPVIGSCVGGIPEILKYKEFLFESENVKELRDKIIAILRGRLDPSHVKSLVTQLRRNHTFDWQETMINAIEDGLTKNLEHSISHK